jgi:NADPH:quinone reductase-like Zn-dependent oxidoreductase
MATKHTSSTELDPEAPRVEINVEAVALCPFALDEVRGEPNVAHDDTQIGVGIAGLVSRDVETDHQQFKRGDEVWSRMPVSLRPNVKQVSLDPAKVFKLSPGITLEQAATLGDSGLMALYAVETAGVKRGGRMLIHGAANPFGSAAIALATHLGAHVIATVDLPHEQRVAAAAGAREVGVARARGIAPTLRKWIKQNGDADGISAVLDGAFLDNAALNLELLAPGGSLVTCLMKGNTTTETQFALAEALARFAKKNINVKFISGHDMENPSLVNVPRMARVISEALAARSYQPVVGQVLSPDELVNALAMLNHGGVVGSLILKPGEHRI